MRAHLEVVAENRDGAARNDAQQSLLLRGACDRSFQQVKDIGIVGRSCSRDHIVPGIEQAIEIVDGRADVPDLRLHRLALGADRGYLLDQRIHLSIERDVKRLELPERELIDLSVRKQPLVAV